MIARLLLEILHLRLVLQPAKAISKHARELDTGYSVPLQNMKFISSASAKLALRPSLRSFRPETALWACHLHHLVQPTRQLLVD
jgi:hypothetical protein